MTPKVAGMCVLMCVLLRNLSKFAIPFSCCDTDMNFRTRKKKLISQLSVVLESRMLNNDEQECRYEHRYLFDHEARF